MKIARPPAVVVQRIDDRAVGTGGKLKRRPLLGNASPGNLTALAAHEGPTKRGIAMVSLQGTLQ